MRRVYLDYAATTPVEVRVAALMSRCLSTDGLFGNASSHLYSYGREAADALEAARSEVATLIGCKISEVVFTSGATESDNAAIKGIAASSATLGKHIITMASEHKAVLMSCKSLERVGWRVSYLRPDGDGNLRIDELRGALRPDTALVSIMHVNNETGVIQDLARVSEVVRESNALLHVDAAQSVGKLPVSFESLGADLMSVSAHKFYGPKGVGALVVGSRAYERLVPLIDGGGQESGLRSGTLANHQIVGLGEACRVARAEQLRELEKVAELRSRLINRVVADTGAIVNCSGAVTYPGILNMSFLDIDAFALLNALSDVAASAASACTTGTLEPSHVLRSMGIEGDRLYGAVRFSFGRFTTVEDIDFASERIAEEVRRLRAIAA
jgi:cysteine desulfurase